jgi:hypothetical protein
VTPNQTTRSLLGYGVLAGPFYVTVSLAQALTRDGFDLTRHAWSLLSNGSLGWIQITNFVLTGLMVPAGTPDGPGAVSWHGIGHLTAGGIGFLCVIVATFVLARHQTLRQGRSGPSRCAGPDRPRRALAWYSRISGLLFLAGFAGIASGNSAPGLTLGFVAAVLVIWTWLALVSLRLYRSLPSC